MNAASCAAADLPFDFATRQTLAESSEAVQPADASARSRPPKLTVNRLQVYSSGGGLSDERGCWRLAAISHDISTWLLLLVLVVVIVGGVKLVKLLWAMLSQASGEHIINPDPQKDAHCA